MNQKKIKIDKKIYQSLILPFYSPASFIPIFGKGSRLFDQYGKEYIDFSSGIGVTALGHNHKRIINSLRKQSKKLWHTSNLFINEPVVRLAKKLVNSTNFASKVFFSNSGTEANEAAFKLARYYSNKKFGFYKNKIISFYNSFHGRTFFTVCVGGQFKYSDGFGPKPSEIIHIPFNDLHTVESVIDNHTCAIVVEPIQGEGGVLPASVDFMKKLRYLCDQYQSLLILDEIQTGMGRTGKLFAYEHYGIKPDIMTLAKALGSGFPIGAMLANKQISSMVDLVGIHGTTYGGNPLSCAVAETSLDIINTDKFLSGVNKKHHIFIKELQNINKRLGLFSEIRGKGLLIGLVLKSEFSSKIKEVIDEAAKEGVIILKAGENVIRLLPSLTIKNLDIKEGILRFYRSLKNVFF